MSSPLMLVALLALPAEAAVDFAGPIAPSVECPFDESADLASVARIVEAPPGGRWWLPRFDEDGVALLAGQGPFSVVDGGGQVHAIEQETLHVTAAVVSLPVPEALSSGAVLQLRENDVPVTDVLLRVSDAAGAGAPLTSESITIADAAPEGCVASCTLPGTMVPAAPLLRVTASGGPAILDAWIGFGEPNPFPMDTSPRVIDSQLVGAADEEASFELSRRLGQFNFVGAIHATVRFRDPHTLEVVHEEVVAGTIGEVPVDALPGAPPECSSAMPMTPMTGCASVGPSSSAAAALLALACLAFARARRPRRATARAARR